MSITQHGAMLFARALHLRRAGPAAVGGDARRHVERRLHRVHAARSTSRPARGSAPTTRAASWRAPRWAAPRSPSPSASTATLDYTINGVSGHARRSSASSSARRTPRRSRPTATCGGAATAQNGWGVAINQQYRTLFSVWYTYDAAGRTIWYVIPGGTWTAANTFTGTAYRTTGSRVAGRALQPGRCSRRSRWARVTFTLHRPRQRRP